MPVSVVYPEISMTRYCFSLFDSHGMHRICHAMIRCRFERFGCDIRLYRLFDKTLEWGIKKGGWLGANEGLFDLKS